VKIINLLMLHHFLSLELESMNSTKSHRFPMMIMNDAQIKMII